MSWPRLSWESPGRDDALPPPREGALNEQDAVAAPGAGEIGVDLIRHGAGAAADESDHEFVGSHHDGHALSSVVHCACRSLRFAWTGKSAGLDKEERRNARLIHPLALGAMPICDARTS